MNGCNKDGSSSRQAVGIRAETEKKRRISSKTIGRRENRKRGPDRHAAKETKKLLVCSQGRGVYFFSPLAAATNSCSRLAATMTADTQYLRHGATQWNIGRRKGASTRRKRTNVVDEAVKPYLHT